MSTDKENVSSKKTPKVTYEMLRNILLKGLAAESGYSLVSTATTAEPPPPSTRGTPRGMSRRPSLGMERSEEDDLLLHTPDPRMGRLSTKGDKTGECANLFHKILVETPENTK